MLNPEIMFITFVFLLLVGTAFWIKIPKISIPLGVIYLVFIISNIFNPEKKLDNESLDDDYYANNQLTENNNSETNKSISNNILVEPVKPKLEPEPLTFDSGRTKKEKGKIVSDTKLISKEKKDKNIIDEKLKKNTNNTIGSDLIVKDIKICKNIYKRTPVGSDVVFSNTVDSLYCFSKIQNPGNKVEVRHVWYYENKIMTQVRYNVKKSNIYRSWTKKTILPNQVGKWRVDILDSYGTIIGSKKFKITNSEIKNR